jgi:multidrug efflux system membrane fusion protein
MPFNLKRSHIIVIVIALLLVLWVLSGPTHEDDTTERPLNPEETGFSVGYKVLSPEQKAHSVRISAHVAANRTVDVIAEVSGKVTAITAKRGTQVAKGDLLLKIDPRDLPARLKQAEAQLKRRQLETESTRNLYKRDLTNQSAVVIAESELAEAEAELTSIRLDLEATQIRAPFDGIYDQRYVEAGEYVSPGTALVRVIDNRTMLIKGALSENHIALVKSGGDAHAELPGGASAKGKIRYIASSASADTRTYEVEMEVSGDTRNMYDGQTATLFVPQGKVDAYMISPALLIITEDSGLGIKVLDADDRVQILPVGILEAATTGVWIHGPSGELRLITVGQGFVDVGEQVQAVESTNSSSNSNDEPTDDTKANES